MPLINRNNFPPSGFPYREASLNWVAPADGAPFDIRVSQIQKVRIANPASGLNPTREACEEALEAYTCARLANDPQWCMPTNNPVAIAAAAGRKPPRCGSCGKRVVRSKTK